MKKVSVRCNKEYVNVFSGVYNHPVFFPLRGGWSSFSIVTCINCSELFVIDWENPATEGLTTADIAGNKNCPTCEASLKLTLRKYPEFILLPQGKVGSFNPKDFISSNDESQFCDFFELLPESQ